MDSAQKSSGLPARRMTMSHCLKLGVPFEAFRCYCIIPSLLSRFYIDMLHCNEYTIDIMVYRVTFSD
ncbi:MAG: hypothetical protein WA151_03405 [Desulfatirhabdiaceae bacterium]